MMQIRNTGKIKGFGVFECMEKGKRRRKRKILNAKH